MLTIQEARARVARGAALLDETFPVWHEHIKPMELNMARDCSCVLGQLDGDYRAGLRKVFRARLSWLRRLFCVWLEAGEGVAYGFDVERWHGELKLQIAHDFKLIQDAWIEAIADRKFRSQNTSQEAQPADAVAGDPHVNSGCTVRA